MLARDVSASQKGNSERQDAPWLRRRHDRRDSSCSSDDARRSIAVADVRREISAPVRSHQIAYRTETADPADNEAEGIQPASAAIGARRIDRIIERAEGRVTSASKGVIVTDVAETGHRHRTTQIPV